MNIIKFKLFNHTTTKATLSILALSVLVACGSGSTTTETSAAATPSTTPAPTPTPTPSAVPQATLVDTFVGTFVSNCETDGNKSTIATATFSKVSESIFAGSTTANVYAGTVCSGSPTKSESLTNMQMTIVGHKVVGGITVRKIMGTATEGVGKFIMFSSGESVGNYIQIGVLDPKDSEGFPEQLETYKMYRK